MLLKLGTQDQIMKLIYTFFTIIGVEVGIILTITLVSFIFRRRNERKERTYSELINYILDNDNLSKEEIDRLPKDKALRNIICDKTAYLDSKSMYKLSRIYIQKGFLANDIKKLKSKVYYIRLRAISRIEQMSLEIPVEIHKEVLNDSNYVVSYVAMYLYITLYKKNSFYQFTQYIMREDLKRGMLYNIIEHFGKNDPDALSYLISRTNNDQHLDALLIAARYEPREEIENIIYKKIKMGAGKRILVNSLKYLTINPNQRFLKLLYILKDHPEWVVRLHVAKALEYYHFPQVSSIYYQLLEDPSFLIRLHLSHSLLNCALVEQTTEAQRAAKNIIEHREHPANSILNYVQDLNFLNEKFKRAA